MVARGGADATSPAISPEHPAPFPVPTDERTLSGQVGTVTVKLRGVSEGAPTQALSAGQPGFSEPVVDGVAWRVYTHVATDTGLRIMVGDTLAVRQQLITGLVQGLLVPALIGPAALVALLWIGVGPGLGPVRRSPQAMAARAPDDTSPPAVDH